MFARMFCRWSKMIFMVCKRYEFLWFLMRFTNHVKLARAEIFQKGKFYNLWTKIALSWPMLWFSAKTLSLFFAKVPTKLRDVSSRHVSFHISPCITFDFTEGVYSKQKTTNGEYIEDVPYFVLNQFVHDSRYLDTV